MIFCSGSRKDNNHTMRLNLFQTVFDALLCSSNYACQFGLPHIFPKVEARSPFHTLVQRVVLLISSHSSNSTDAGLIAKGHVVTVGDLIDKSFSKLDGIISIS